MFNDKLDERPFFTAKEAASMGISNRMLSYYAKIGRIRRIAQGLYTSTSYEPKDEDLNFLELATAAANIPGGVICLVSALNYYELTEQFMRKLWIAVPNDSSKVLKIPNCKIVRYRNMDLGVEEIEMSSIKVRIFNKERTIVDAFKLLDEETAIYALRAYLRDDKREFKIDRLWDYAKELRVSKTIHYIKAYVA